MWYYEKEFARVTIRVQARTIKEAYNLLIFKAAFHPKYMQQETTVFKYSKKKGKTLTLKRCNSYLTMIVLNQIQIKANYSHNYLTPSPLIGAYFNPCVLC